MVSKGQAQICPTCDTSRWRLTFLELLLWPSIWRWLEGYYGFVLASGAPEEVAAENIFKEPHTSLQNNHISF
jgi:hypothetical protein